MVFTRSFGYADLQKRKPVESDETLFRTGFVAKLITCKAMEKPADCCVVRSSPSRRTYQSISKTGSTLATCFLCQPRRVYVS